MTSELAATGLHCTHWAMRESDMIRLCERLRAAAPRHREQPAAQLPGRPPLLRVRGDVGVIPISGILMDSVPAWMGYFFDANELTGHDEIRAAVAAAVADPGVREIRLDVASPGGMVAGGKSASDTLYAARAVKPVTAHVEDLAASAAYRLAAQADRITVGEDAEVGSIGVYAVWMDLSQLYASMGAKVIVVRSGALKGAGVPGDPITPEQLAAEQAIVDGMAANLVAEIARGRGASVESVRRLATGQVWLGRQAVDMGLADEVRQSVAIAESTRAGAVSAASVSVPDPAPAATADPAQSVEVIMSETTTPAVTQPEPAAAAPAAPAPEVAEMQTRMQETLDALAAELKKTQEAMAAQAAEMDALRKAAAPRRGAEPIPVDGTGTPECGADGDFLAAARAKAKADGTTVTQAMVALQRANPAMHAAWLEREQDRVAAARAAL